MDKVAHLISPDDFYKPVHKTIYSAMLSLLDKSEPQDLVTVTNSLKDSHKLDEVGGPTYLASLTDIVPVSANIAHYAKIVRDKSILRQLIQTSSEIAGRCYEEQDDIDLLIDEVEKNIFDISSSKSSQSFYQMNELIGVAFKNIESLAERPEMVTGVPSGYDKFDQKTAGLQPSDLIIIAGRPSMGKTALAMNMVQNAAMLAKIPAAVFSLEMSKEQLALRMLCSISRVESTRIRTGHLHDSDWPKLVRATGMLDNTLYWVS